MRTHLSNTELWKGVLTLLSLALLVTIGYGYMLSLDFTATDSLLLIQNSRLRTWQDLEQIFGEGIMGGEFYRPLAQLSYSLDHALSGLSPAGYQLTDLLLHMAVTLQLALLARRMEVPGGWTGAWLSGALFALHPILIESVPAVARRHDLLAAALGLLALLLLDGARYRLRSTRGILSLTAALLALGSKEIAVIIPALVVSDIWLNRPCRSRKHQLTTSLGWIALTALFLTWRQTRGAIGPDLTAALGNLDEARTITQGYFAGLLAPMAPSGGAQGIGAIFVIAGAAGLAGLSIRGFLRRSRFYIFWSMGVLSCWLLLVVTRRPDPRNLYLPAACLCMMWGGALAEVASKLAHQPALRNAAPGLPILMVVLGWVSVSPLWVSYPGWRTASTLTREIRQTADDAAQLLPAGSTLHILNLPDAIIPPATGLSERSVSVVQDHTIQSWLDMRRPDHPIQVSVCSLRPVPADIPRPPLMVHYYGNAASIVVASKPEEKDIPWSLFWWEGCQTEPPDPKEAEMSALPTGAKPGHAQLGDAILLEGYRLGAQNLQAGQNLSLMLYWSTSERVSQSYTVFVHLVDEGGEVMAQQDNLPVSGTYPTDQWPTDTLVADGHGVLIAPDTRPGRYTLIAGMYDLQTMERLPVHILAEGEEDKHQRDAVVLGEVRIKPQR